MDTNELQTIDIPRILSLSPVIDEYSLGKDFILGEMSGSRVQHSQAVLDLLRYPVRFDGYIIFFLRKGSFKLDVNLNTYEVGERTLLVTVPASIVRISSFNPDAELRFVLISRDFMNSIPVDFVKVYRDSIRLWNTPCITLAEEELQLLEKYFLLAREILASPRLPSRREILGSLLTSVTYLSMDVWTRQLSVSRDTERYSSARANLLFERFIALVTEHHVSERGMAFYADKLCLTPKYLSKVIKQATGRSAPDWIDAFVILEAKNLLKYSDKSIKEIVFALHFPNQSVFYKYFKAHTGLTPSEYRKG